MFFYSLSLNKWTESYCLKSFKDKLCRELPRSLTEGTLNLYIVWHENVKILNIGTKHQHSAAPIEKHCFLVFSMITTHTHRLVAAGGPLLVLMFC